MPYSGKEVVTFLGRTDQLDAKELDSELGNIFTDRLNSAFRYLPIEPSFPAVDKLGPEIKILVKFFLYYWTIFYKNASMGQQLLKIKMAENTSTWKKVFLMMFLLELPDYLVQRKNLFSRLISEETEHVLDRLKQVTQICSIANCLVFLQQGKYPTLNDRLLCITYQKVANQQRSLSYQYLSRELLWHSARELLTFALPLLNLNRFKSFIGNFLPKAVLVANSQNTPTLPMQVDQDCEMCHYPLVLPCSAGCQHLFCYCCLKTNLTLMSNHEFKCPICRQNLSEQKLHQFKLK